MAGALKTKSIAAGSEGDSDQVRAIVEAGPLTAAAKLSENSE